MIKEKANEAIPFITFDEKQGFKLNQEAIDYLSQLPKDRKLGIVSIVGKYRTGKSFFVNRVLLNSTGNTSGFSVGPTINPCTKGLWLWKQTLKSQSDEDMDILLIDTEGFGGMDENVNHDSRIFLFSLLLSSYFIYNSVGAIDENALNNLSLIINLAKDIQIKSGKKSVDDEDLIAQYFPQFLWIVRDFALQLKDNVGNPISAKEYLEKSLENQKGMSDAVESKNRTRRMLKHFFKERDCQTMVRPTEQEKDLQNLNSIENQQLRPEFVNQMNTIRNRIFKRVKPKTMGDKFLNGDILIEMCQAYIQAINTGQMPNIENAWTYVCKSESRKALETTIDSIQKKLFQENTTFDNVALEQLKSKLYHEALKEFKKIAIAPQEELQEYIQQLDKQFSDKFKEFKKKNKTLWKAKYEEISRDQIQEIEQKLNDEIYENYFEFQQDFLKFKDDYDSKTPNGPSKEAFWQEISGRLHKLAAEKVSKNLEKNLQKENKTFQNKLQMLEQELQTKKLSFDSEKKQLYDKVASLERQKSELEITLTVSNERNQRLKDENTRIQTEFTTLKTTSKEYETKREQEIQKQIKELQDQLYESRQNAQKSGSELQMQNALLTQEKQFLDKEISQLKENNQNLLTENKKNSEELKVSHATIDKLQERINKMEQDQQQELDKIRDEWQVKIQSITAETNEKKDILKQHQDWIVQKTYLENQVTFLKNQLDENKRLHDALLLALQQGMTHQDQESATELMETNKNLSAAMEKMELRCTLLEEKNEKLKIFKKMMKNSSALQCIHCSKFIANSIFVQHLNQCSEINSSSQNQNSEFQHSQLNFSQNQGNNQQNNNNNNNQQNQYLNGVPPLFFNLDANGLQICINQTMVRESPDNKPYTEYLIQLQYQNVSWTVARKYKNFCELHSVLYNCFQGLKFPESSIAIINSQTDINSVFYSKRPTVIEERRKALQQYIRDLAQIDVVRNSKPFKNFLEVDKNLESSSQSNNNSQVMSKHDNQNFQIQQQSQNVPQQIQNNRSEIMNMVNSFFQQNSGKEEQNQFKIDKKMLPQSPQSFIKNWQEKNKENNNQDYLEQEQQQNNDIYSSISQRIAQNIENEPHYDKIRQMPVQQTYSHSNSNVNYNNNNSVLNNSKNYQNNSFVQQDNNNYNQNNNNNNNNQKTYFAMQQKLKQQQQQQYQKQQNSERQSQNQYQSQAFQSQAISPNPKEYNQQYPSSSQQRYNNNRLQY